MSDRRDRLLRALDAAFAAPHRRQLWVLNSGTGELGGVELGKTGGCFAPAFSARASCAAWPFTAGTPSSGFEAALQALRGTGAGREAEAADSEPWCGVQVIDLDNGTCVDWFRIDGAVAELYDVAVIPGVACPMSLGFASNEIKTLITYEGLKPKTAVATPP